MDAGPSVDVAAVAHAAVIHAAGIGIRHQQMPCAIEVLPLIPDPHAVSPQVGGVAAVQPGHPDDGAQIHRLCEGTHYVLILPPIAGGPVGAVVPVNHVLGDEGGVGSILIAVDIIRVSQDDAGDLPVVQDALGGDARRTLIGHSLGRALGNVGLGPQSHIIACNHVEAVGHAVGQALNDGLRLGQLAAGLNPLTGALLLVVDHKVGGVLARLPAHGQRAVHGGDGNHVRLIRDLGGPGGGKDGLAGLTFPAAVGGCDGEEVVNHVLQARYQGAGDIHMELLDLRLLVLGPIEDLVARHVGQLAPAQADRFVRRLSLQVLHRAVGGGGVLRNDVLKELDHLHSGIVALCGLGDSDCHHLHRHPLAQVDGDDTAAGGAADGVGPLRRGLVKGDDGLGAVFLLHEHMAGQDLARPHRGDELDLRHHHRRIQGKGEDDIPAAVGGELDRFAVVQEEVLQIAAFQIRPGVVQGGLDIVCSNRRGQQIGLQRLGIALGRQLPVDIGQIYDVDLPVAVQVIARQVLGRGGVQGGREVRAVAHVHLAVAVHIPQGKGGVASAHDDMPGVVLHFDGLLIADIAPAGESEGVAAPGQALDVQVQIPGPQAAVQVAALIVPGRDNCLVAAHGILPGLGQRHSTQDGIALADLHLHAPLLELIQGLGVVNPQCSRNTAGHVLFLRRLGVGRERQRGERHEYCQQGRQQALAHPFSHNHIVPFFFAAA